MEINSRMWNISAVVCSVVAYDAGCSREIRSNKMKNIFTIKLDFNLRKKLVKCYIWYKYMCGVDIWTLRKVDQKCVGSFEMWFWRRMEKISWTDRVRSEEELERVKGERNIIHTVNRRKANLIGHILRRNCLLKHVIPGKKKGGIEVTERRGKDTNSYWMTFRKREGSGN
jgi:hypothetical protein